ncbi:IclR family transcriptional regulator [Kineococcus rhizosphaerae]|uniref:IclR family transcriptional regulator n=1 Tax=Kineococcus rhizosphaerae TaxID=559628 RepID=A0A2T0R710_9ACTN|nr:IclR family transcriptional regulator [Kineococcus rhizosphaerae]PRY16933.1 IclR family transcriptional regulator [Kineococcus rhizosphaerae]
MGGVATVERTLAVLEVVAERGGASAREVSDVLGLPLPTTYRLLQVLVGLDYLVHLRTEKRFELGYKLDRLGVSLHRQVGVPANVRAEVGRLHEVAGAAAYFAVYRGADVVVAHVADSARFPRITPMNFGFHEAAHATAFGKILLAGMAAPEAAEYLDAHGTAPLTPTTITDRDELAAHLAEVSRRGVAWEREEFVPGFACAAVAVHDPAGSVVGAVAISTPDGTVDRRRATELEKALRESANRVSRWLRTG